MELEVTWGRAIRVWWAYVWRNIIAIIVAMLIGAVLGAILGAIMGALHVPLETIKIIVTPIGVILGFAISIVPIKLILGKDFGEFRLVLIKK
ncbi:MAG: hypothetical protein ACAH12_04540 [Methylophilaceae bacterium]|uniref:hypothetical protein n=1 Tax=Methylovorus sp. MM2 TaxID=1848038 RepID=UPI0007DFEDC8|nr:hypothetical protein [Methylovorus sp. MM2]OAM52447.1 hypothetical protein A7981_02920 [Methylovorus sp. MM2]